MSDVRGRVEDLIDSLGELSPAGSALAEIALALAEDVDDPPKNDKGVPQSRSAPARALQACLAELVVKGRAHVDDDDGAAGWADIAAAAGATPIRYAEEPDPGDVRRRGGGGRSAAP